MSQTITIDGVGIRMEDILPRLPQLKINATAEARRPPLMGGFDVIYDKPRKKWLVRGTSFLSPKWATRDFDSIDELNSELTKALFEYYKGSLEAAVTASVYDICLALAEQVPYPQDCQCQKYPEGQALDCHVHMDNPRHFVGHFDFACTCHQQMER